MTPRYDDEDYTPEQLEWARKQADIQSRGPRIKALLEDVAQRGIKFLDRRTIAWIKTLPTPGITGIISAARDGETHGHLLYTDEMRLEEKMRRAAEKALRAQERKEEAQRKQSGDASSREKPEQRLIRSPRDAELTAEAWMRYFGFDDARVTPVGADEGIDVDSSRAVAQVKAHMVPIGRPDVQNLAGVAAAEKKMGIFFALNGYTPQAIAWADRADIALFSFDLQGEPEAINVHARRLME